MTRIAHVADTCTGPRLHAERLMGHAALQEAHPEMPIGEVIADSGFGSRTTYYKIKRELQG